MSEMPKSRRRRGGQFLALVADSTPLPQPGAHVSLRRAAGMVEDAAFDLAGTVPPDFVSRLIEIAAELDRAATDREETPRALKVACAAD